MTMYVPPVAATSAEQRASHLLGHHVGSGDLFHRVQEQGGTAPPVLPGTPHGCQHTQGHGLQRHTHSGTCCQWVKVQGTNEYSLSLDNPFKLNRFVGLV
jgi:hypothetical protein